MHLSTCRLGARTGALLASTSLIGLLSVQPAAAQRSQCSDSTPASGDTVSCSFVVQDGTAISIIEPIGAPAINLGGGADITVLDAFLTNGLDFEDVDEGFLLLFASAGIETTQVQVTLTSPESLQGGFSEATDDLPDLAVEVMLTDPVVDDPETEEDETAPATVIVTYGEDVDTVSDTSIVPNSLQATTRAARAFNDTLVGRGATARSGDGLAVAGGAPMAGKAGPGAGGSTVWAVAYGAFADVDGTSDNVGYDESGAGAFNLDVSDDNFDQTFFSVGMMAETAIETEGGMVVRPGLDLHYERLVGARNTMSGSVLSTIGGAGFADPGAREGRDRVTVNAGVAVDVNESWSASLGYQGTLSGSSQAHGVQAGVTFRF